VVHDLGNEQTPFVPGVDKRGLSVLDSLRPAVLPHLVQNAESVRLTNNLRFCFENVKAICVILRVAAVRRQQAPQAKATPPMGSLTQRVSRTSAGSALLAMRNPLRYN
jgi:hypothetical protein